MIAFQLLQIARSQSNPPVQVRIQLRIPQKYYLDPVISKLVSHFKLNVNLIAATLGKGGQGDGWFDLKLQGDFQQINNALTYLADLDIDVWHKDNNECDEW
jgi:hypothetical protein